MNMDVASYYPALMIEYNYLSRNVADPSKFRKIRDDRLVMKANKDPRQLPYKIVINGTYGAMKDKYNGLYDPLQANNVCIAGQLLLLDLIEKLEDHCDIIQSNTDGVLVKLRDEKDYDKIIGIGQEWSERTRMELEYETVHKVFQKDVNNYIIVDAKGKVKSKGAWTKTWERYEGNSPVPDYIDYDMVILRKAIHAYFVNGIPVEETIHNNKDMIDFQKIVMVSRKYHYGLHGDKPLNERHLRVFASKNESDGGIFKLSVAKNNLNKANDTSPHSFLVNESVVGLSTDDFPQLDKQFYIDMVNDRIKKFVKQN